MPEQDQAAPLPPPPAAPPPQQQVQPYQNQYQYQQQPQGYPQQQQYGYGQPMVAQQPSYYQHPSQMQIQQPYAGQAWAQPGMQPGYAPSAAAPGYYVPGSAVAGHQGGNRPLGCCGGDINGVKTCCLIIAIVVLVFNIVCLISWSSRINYENSRQDSYGGGGVGYMDPNRQYGGSGYSQREMKSEDITYIHGHIAKDGLRETFDIICSIGCGIFPATLLLIGAPTLNRNLCLAACTLLIMGIAFQFIYMLIVSILISQSIILDKNLSPVPQASKDTYMALFIVFRLVWLGLSIFFVFPPWNLYLKIKDGEGRTPTLNAAVLPVMQPQSAYAAYGEPPAVPTE